MTDTHGTYKTKRTGSPPALRPGTLLRYSDPEYTPPEKEEFAAVIEFAGLSSAECGTVLGVDARSIRRYKSGREIQYAIWRLLLIETGIVTD